VKDESLMEHPGADGVVNGVDGVDGAEERLMEYMTWLME